MAPEPETVQRIARLTPLADVLARIDAVVQPVAPREVGRSAVPGRILAGDCIVTRRPRAALAMRDGWAVDAERTADASSYAPIELPAVTLIDVGEPLPAGASAVAPLDTVIRRGDRVQIIAPVGAGEGVLLVGADADRPAELLRRGQRLTAVRAAVLAVAEADPVVLREPRIRLAPLRGNDPVLTAIASLIAAAAGAEGATILPTGSDEELEVILTDESADAVIAIGGTGSGRHDASVHALARIGRVEAHGIALSPGETVAFGLVGRRPVLLLPGRLDSALACWMVLGRRMLARLSASIEEEPTTKATLARKVTSALGLAEVIPVRCRDGAAEPLASGYLPLSELAAADGWMLVPAQSEGYPAGTEVVIRPWP